MSHRVGPGQVVDLLLHAPQAADQSGGGLHEILTPLDELKYWADLAANPAMGE